MTSLDDIIPEGGKACLNRCPANVPEKKLKKGAKRIVMGYVADLAHIK